MEIIPNLPEEIGRDCLVRVPYKSHGKLKGVCRSWRNLVKSPWFYHQRKASGTSEQCIFLLHALRCQGGELCANNKQNAPAYGITTYDPVQGSWARISPIPQFPSSVPLFSKSVAVKEKLIVIGGWHPSGLQSLDGLFIYDVSGGRWSCGANMPTVRSFFGCCVSEQGIVYVVGGHDDDKNALSSVEAYDVEKNVWESLPPMNRARDECEAHFIDGKLIVLSGYETASQGRFLNSGEVFDPQTGTWNCLESIWGFGHCPRLSVAAFGSLYYFCKQGVMQYNGKQNVWVQVGSVPEGIRVSSCVAVGQDKIFVTGSDGDQMMHCYMFEVEKGKWVEVERVQGFGGFVQCATALEL